MIQDTQIVEILSQSEPAIRAMGSRRLQSIQQRIDCDDIMQIVAIKAIRHRDAIQSDCPEVVSHWIKKIGYNCVKQAVSDHRAAKRSVARESAEAPTGAFTPVDSLVIEDEFSKVKAAIAQICPTQAKAVKLRYLQMAEYHEIAEQLGCSINAARLLVSRGIAAVRSILV